jgi:L-iditol 2-dehydrogenase
MQAIVLESKGQLRVREHAMPTPQAGEYRLKIRSTGICHSDCFRAYGGEAYQYPLIMGHETCGTVDACGPGVSRFRTGDRVVVFPLVPCGACEPCQEQKWVLCRDYDYYGSRRDGGYQEYLCVREWNLLRVPDDQDLFYAALAEPLSVCYRATSHLNHLPRKAEILVLGGGLLGLVSAVILQQTMGFGAVFVADRNPFKRAFAQHLGLAPLRMEECAHGHERFGGVLEACGAPSTYQLSLDCARREATVVWMGNITGDLELSQQQVSRVLRKELTLKGTWNSDYQGGVHDDWQAALALLARADWLADLVTHRLSPAQVGAHLREMYEIKRQHRPHHIFKAMIDFG